MSQSKKDLLVIARLLNYIQIEGNVADEFDVHQNSIIKGCDYVDTNQSRRFLKLMRDARKALHRLEDKYSKETS